MAELLTGPIMNNVTLNNYYHLKKGLELADRDEMAELAGVLPQNSSVAPVELPGTGNIDRLLENRGTEAVQFDWIRPQAAGPEVLTPSGFNSALAGAIRTLGAAAQRANDDEAAAALSRAARDLKGLVGLRDQVWASMQALLAG